MNNEIELSVVATVYNDEIIVPQLVAEIKKSIQCLHITFEIILVDDYSKDNSRNAIIDECSKDKNVKAIFLSRNYGQQIALSAGINNTSGNYVVLMDGDLQNPPSFIPELYSMIKKGYDVVNTTNYRRNNFIDAIMSKIFWYIMNNILRTNFVKSQLTLQILKREIVNKYINYLETNRHIFSIIHDITTNYIVINVKNEKRYQGKSKYNFLKRLNLAIDIIINTTNAPLNIMIYIGFISVILTLIISAYFIFNYIFFDVPMGYTSLLLSIYLFGGLIVFLLGVVGKYLANINSEVKHRPLYYIEKKYNF